MHHRGPGCRISHRRERAIHPSDALAARIPSRELNQDPELSQRNTGRVRPVLVSRALAADNQGMAFQAPGADITQKAGGSCDAFNG